MSRVVCVAACSGALAACTLEHHAPLRAAPLPPLAPAVLHSSRLWVELGDSTPDTQCVKPETQRLLCFEHVQSTFRQTLQRSLWTSFPEVGARSWKDIPEGDYLLVVELGLEALPPDASGPGWSAGAKVTYKLLRDGKTLVAEGLASRSRSEFAYGEPLGQGAAETVEAVATRIAVALGAVPESREIAPHPLPAVAAEPLPTSEPLRARLPGEAAPAAPVAPAASAVAPTPAKPVAESEQPSAAPVAGL